VAAGCADGRREDWALAALLTAALPKPKLPLAVLSALVRRSAADSASPPPMGLSVSVSASSKSSSSFSVSIAVEVRCPLSL
jgi:hypothetical protein